jgi:hypothetical protein
MFTMRDCGWRLGVHVMCILWVEVRMEGVFVQSGKWRMKGFGDIRSRWKVAWNENGQWMAEGMGVGGKVGSVGE